MKVTSLLSLVAAATLVSAGEFFPLGGLPDADFVPGAYIVEVCYTDHCCSRQSTEMLIDRPILTDNQIPIVTSSKMASIIQNPASFSMSKSASRLIFATNTTYSMACRSKSCW